MLVACIELEEVSTIILIFQYEKKKLKLIGTPSKREDGLLTLPSFFDFSNKGTQNQIFLFNFVSGFKSHHY